jgi:hypothetical protein
MAAHVAADRHFSIWSSVILCAASSAGCTLLISEDMHDGFTWGGTTVVDPFAADRHPLPAAVLSGKSVGLGVFRGVTER